MNHQAQRRKLRTILTGSQCISPASVFDPLSARSAESVGYEFGFLAGSVASETILAAPDMTGLTLSELAGQIRRIMRVSNLSLIVDADHGYGNALNAMRTVQELEHAGVSALIIEDTVLPDPYGQAEGVQSLVSIEEGIGKLRSAVAARQDPSLVIAARTSIKTGGLESMIARARAYAATGIDAFFVAGGLKTLRQLEAIHAACDLPIMLGVVPPALKREELAARGARVLLLGHQPLAASLKALQETYAHLHSGGSPDNLPTKTISTQEMERLINAETYAQWHREYLG